ncbi:hypothetical protein N9L31_00060 [bacterium]|nr:hypothetical protein [bacterium]
MQLPSPLVPLARQLTILLRNRYQPNRRWRFRLLNPRSRMAAVFPHRHSSLIPSGRPHRPPAHFSLYLLQFTPRLITGFQQGPCPACHRAVPPLQALVQLTFSLLYRFQNSAIAALYLQTQTRSPNRQV